MTEADYLTRAARWNEYRPRQEFKVVEKTVYRRGRKVKNGFLSRWLSLDTETAWNHDDENPAAWIYQWAFKFGEDIVTGRRPSEFCEVLKALAEHYELSKSKKLVIFCHNLSYDIQYLKDFLRLYFGKCKILAVKPHKFITFECGPFLFKCTYKLSNKSLSTWANDLGTAHQKLKEEKSYYDEIHYQDEVLTNENWIYQILDVVVLDECVEKQMEAYGDTLVTIPLTSTGYVRRQARKNYKQDRKNRKKFLATALDEITYSICREEFAGGLTHGNRFVAGRTCRPKKGWFIRHRDFRSHYPTQQRTRKFPVGKFNLYKENASIEDVRELMREYCLLMKVTFKDVEVHEGVILPIISVSKALRGKLTKLDIIDDNGRILKCDGIFSLCLTELDLHWILKQYEVKGGYNIDCIYTAKKGYMPPWMIRTVDEFFLGKTKWKDLHKKAKEAKEPLEKIVYLALELMKAKNGLNGIYGMTATDIVREIFEMDERGEWTHEKPEISKALSDYYQSENSFNRYQWGAFCTSWARFELLEYADLITKAGGTVLYVDTDSIFYVSNNDIENAIERENERRREHAEAIGAFVEYEGKRITYDSFDDEKEDITAFRFLHAKCYAYVCEGELKCVIAGVPEYEDATLQFSREMELGSIDNLEVGQKFVRCGGTKSAYDERGVTHAEINGHMTEFASSCIITPSHKELRDELTQYDYFYEWESD